MILICTIQKLKQDINRNKLRKYDATQCIKTLNNQNSVYKYGKIEYNVYNNALNQILW